jgi:hypothetical protein
VQHFKGGEGDQGNFAQLFIAPYHVNTYLRRYVDRVGGRCDNVYMDIYT